MVLWMERLFRRLTPLGAADAYERWAPNYPPNAHNELMKLEEGAVREVLPDVRGCKALDLACGSGRYIRILRQLGAAPVVGLDASPAMLRRARDLGTNLVQADVRRLCLRPRSFQIVTCGLAVGHVKELHRTLFEVSQVLTTGGAVVYSDFHPLGSWLGWRRTFRDDEGVECAARHYTHFFSDHVQACQSAGLHIEEVREPRIRFKSRWQGYPALLIIRARKKD